jgi:hypothetical protein
MEGRLPAPESQFARQVVALVAKLTASDKPAAEPAKPKQKGFLAAFF